MKEEKKVDDEDDDDEGRDVDFSRFGGIFFDEF